MTPDLPPPVVEFRDDVHVVRDDLLPGGTKRRALVHLLRSGRHYVYGGPAYGHAQIALAVAAADVGAAATVFVAKRRQPHPRTVAAMKEGATVVQVPSGYLSVVRARAKAFGAATGAEVLPFGLDLPAIVNALAGVARGLDLSPREVWTVAGSGVLTRALQLAWPAAAFHAVEIGRHAEIGSAQRHIASERFEQDAAVPPPFPSCSNYDAKAWRFIRTHAAPGALFWNVAS